MGTVSRLLIYLRVVGWKLSPLSHWVVVGLDACMDGGVAGETGLQVQASHTDELTFTCVVLIVTLVLLVGGYVVW